MRRIRLILGLTLLTGMLFVLAGCQPPAYSNDKRKEVTKEHKADGVAWFASHRPEAKASEGRAYADGVDLFAVIEGTYSVGKTEYTYLYDFDADIMYTSEMYLSVVDAVETMAAQSLGVARGELSIGFYRSLIQAKTLNDKDDQGMHSGNGFPYDGVLTEGIDVEAFAAASLRGETELSAYASMITGTVPTPSEAFLTDCAELLPLRVLIPVELDAFGAYACDIDAETVQENTICLKSVREGLIGGYVMNGVCTEEAIINDNGDEIEFILPEGALLILLWEGKGQPYVLLKNSDGTDKSVPISERSCLDCGISGYKKVSNYAYYDDIVLPVGKATVYIYQADSRTENGTFRVTIQEKK